jgi:hypothetical protein
MCYILIFAHIFTLLPLQNNYPPLGKGKLQIQASFIKKIKGKPGVFTSSIG